MSSGRAAYGAGLLVGWGETGRRPLFATITAVGTSALIAPFAFLGVEGDRKIADIFNCEAGSLDEMARQAAANLDDATLKKIALRHEQGARLLVALPGSAARPETVWDLGEISASNDPQRWYYMARILAAAVDLTTFIDPASIPIPAGAIVERDRQTFHEPGAGEQLLSPGPSTSAMPAYVIHNGVLFPDESTEFMAWRDASGNLSISAQSVPLVPAYDFFRAAKSAGTEIRLASPRPFLTIQPRSAFDMAYNRALFLYAFRNGRMKQEWRRSFPDWQAYQR